MVNFKLAFHNPRAVLMHSVQYSLQEISSTEQDCAFNRCTLNVRVTILQRFPSISVAELGEIGFLPASKYVLRSGRRLSEIRSTLPFAECIGCIIPPVNAVTDWLFGLRLWITQLSFIVMNVISKYQGRL